MRQAVVATLAAALAASAANAQVSFTSGPRVVADPGGARIEFAPSGPADVEVAIVNGRDRVVRHLAAGLVGGEKAASPLTPGLAQAIVWDNKDDAGKPVVDSEGPYKVRVRAGLTARVGRVIGEPARLTGKVYGLATDEKGNLYVASGGVYSTALFSIKVFDRGGNYLRTILPMPATLSPEQAREFGGARAIDGHLTPANHNPLVPYVQVGGIDAVIGGSVRGGVLWLIAGGRIARLGDDGRPIQWASGPKARAPSGGPMTWAVTADNRTLYMAGWWDVRGWQRAGYKGDPNDHGDGVVFEVDPATGQAEPFVTVPVPADNRWMNQRDGHFHYTNWGRKNGVAALHGLAVDADGRLHVCDRTKQRLAVYDASGKLLGSTPISDPDHVALSPAGDTVYVTTRTVLDDYRAVNEFRVVKLSKAIDGRVLAEVTLKGNNAPSVAVDATARPAVIWLSNVGQQGEKLVRIEDRGDSLVVTGELNDTLPASDSVVKVWVDRNGDDVYVNNGWNGLSRYDGLTGQGGPIPIKAIDLAIGDDGLLYLYGRAGWNEPIYRCDREFNPVNFTGTGKPTTDLTTAAKPDPKTGELTRMPVYGRYGTGWSNKGVNIGPDGRIFVRSMFDWNQYFVTVFKPDGLAEYHGRIQGGIAGPLDNSTGGICIDRQGYLYLGAAGWPVELGQARSAWDGSVVKVKPTGGGVAPLVRDKDGKVADGEGMLFANHRFEGAVTAYPYLAPRNERGCVCKEARFDLDDFGRLYVPDVLDFCIRVYDNAGNLLGAIGHYGNSESSGPGSAIPRPAVPFGWPMSCSINRAGRLYVADVLNQRIVRVDLGGAIEEVLALK